MLKKMLCLAALLGVSGVFWTTGQGRAAGEESTEQFLKKYSLAESLELGFEMDATSPLHDEFSGIQKYFLTAAHTINENSTFKLKFGSLTADYEDTKANNVAAGTLREAPFSVSLITGLNRSGTFKPYLGWGLNFVRYVDFDADLPRYAEVKARNTVGYHLVAGFKYISTRNFTLSLDLTGEQLKPFTLKDRLMVLPKRKVNLSNASIGLSIALLF
ncbi:MAG: OmpW family outer membrane protein [Planctomycetota bacterium]